MRIGGIHVRPQLQERRDEPLERAATVRGGEVERRPAARIAGRHVCAGQYEWPDALEPYVKNLQIFMCPSDRSSKIGYGWCAYRGYWNHPTNTDEIYTGVSIGSPNINDPSVAPIACDHDPSSANATYYYAWYLSQVYDWGQGSDIHNGGMNIAFLDGHCKWYMETNALDHSYDGGPLQWVTSW